MLFRATVSPNARTVACVKMVSASAARCTKALPVKFKVSFQRSNFVVDASGMESIFLFIGLVALVIVGIMALRKSDEYKARLGSAFPDQQVNPNAQFHN